MPLNLLESKDLESLIKKREGEVKIGEQLILGELLQSREIHEIEAQFVIIGVPEDVGPRANLGKAGAESGWEYFLPAFLNLQENQYLKGEDILMLGSIDIRDHAKYRSKDVSELRELVKQLDRELSELISLIIQAEKTPILIGGGHNNAYPLIKGSSTALKQKINCINLDPHADYRAMEGRHSGNGFRYAREEGYLDRYHVCGLHQNYNSAEMLELFEKDEGLSYDSFDHCIIQQRKSFKEMLKHGLDQVKKEKFGVELDCDGIQAFPSSAQTSSGFSPNQARMYTYAAASEKQACYFHLTEAAPILAGGQAAYWGKLMAYLVSDFIKGRSHLFSGQ